MNVNKLILRVSWKKCKSTITSSIVILYVLIIDTSAFLTILLNFPQDKPVFLRFSKTKLQFLIFWDFKNYPFSLSSFYFAFLFHIKFPLKSEVSNITCLISPQIASSFHKHLSDNLFFLTTSRKPKYSDYTTVI